MIKKANMNTNEMRSMHDGIVEGTAGDSRKADAMFSDMHAEVLVSVNESENGCLRMAYPYTQAMSASS